ncbi:MAG: hypothetical protein V7745_01015 [Pseudomonadales bacterium]
MNKTEWRQHLATQQAQFSPNDDNIIDSFSASTSEQTTYITPLLYQGMLSIKGLDSAKFLQGQLTCDVHKASAQQSILGAVCSPQGRMFSSFRLLQKNNEAEPEFLLRMRSDLVDSSHETLHKYSVFFKTQLTNASDEWLGLGIWGDQSEQLISDIFALTELPQQAGQAISNETTIVIRVPGDTARFECWVKADQISADWQLLIAKAKPTATYNWILEDIKQGIAEVCFTTLNAFNPHMVNFQAIDAISFDKGCYTGQEIVARTHYRGKSKRHMQRFSLSGGKLLAPGDNLINPDSQKTIATVVAAALTSNTGQDITQEALLVTSSDLDSSSPLTLQHDEQTYQSTIQPLPYSLD